MHVIRGNVDSAENIRILVSYQDCLVNKFKACEQEAAQLRESFKAQLLEELSIRYVEVMDDPKSSDDIKDEMIYDMCGYLLKTRDSVWKDCAECKKGLRSTVIYHQILCQPSTLLSATTVHCYSQL